LIAAAGRGLASLVRKLLKAGADLAAVTANGRNAVSAAAAGGHYDLAEELLGLGCSALGSALIGPIQKRVGELGRARYRNEPPNPAIMNPALALIQKLIGKGAKLKVKFDLSGQLRPQAADTLLGCAVRAGDEEVVRELIAAGVDIDEKTLGNPPIVMAISNKHPGVVQLLIDAGARLEALSSIGWTPLTTAVDFSNKEIIEQLLSAGAEPSKKGRASISAFGRAKEKGNPEILALLQAASPGKKRHAVATAHR
jgi:uncharacterized protein